MSAEDSHPIYDVTVVGPVLHSLHAHVARNKTRIEITRRGSDERCVLISKEELACLEHAIGILSQTEHVRDISGQIAAVVNAAQQPMRPSHTNRRYFG